MENLCEQWRTGSMAALIAGRDSNTTCYEAQLINLMTSGYWL